MSTPVEGRIRTGILCGLGAYGAWGLFPLYWPLLARAGAVEILAHRIIWALVFAIVLTALLRRRGLWAQLRQRRDLGLLAIASAVIALNWGVYIWAVNNGHVVETALGYYINPILSILLGVLLLRERLPRWQWAAVGLALVAVVVLTVEFGRPPVIALVLATSFASYGLLKKHIHVDALLTLVVESAFLFLPALAFLLYRESAGLQTFGHAGWLHTVLLITSGIATVLPLLCFTAAATRIPLSTLGLLQYLTPTLQFLIGVLYFHEAMSTGRWAGFVLVWIALVILAAGGLLTYRSARRGTTALLAHPAGKVRPCSSDDQVRRDTSRGSNP